MDSGYYYGRNAPLDPHTMNNSAQLEEPRAVTDYLLTSFQEYKITVIEL